ncbi:hypothetical protein [Alteromonas mediterranea]|uniref:hypothetical protein n=1 Tax=Alteromonas mediterranea TaxID=314275 RepID=UPI0012DB6ACC|nr:hypothetical protein [Alteromonas mediterranea]
MKKLKSNQIGPWCSFCSPKTARAVYREDGFARRFCCEIHKDTLLMHERDTIDQERRVTEADIQTWEAL